MLFFSFFYMFYGSVPGITTQRALLGGLGSAIARQDQLFLSTNIVKKALLLFSLNTNNVHLLSL